VSRPVSRYRPSRRYYLLLLLAVVGVGVSAWSGIRWPAAWLAACGFTVSALALLALVLRPTVEIHESHLKLGRRRIAWSDIRALDRTGWNAPLVLRMTLAGEAGAYKLTLIYPGDLDACRSLLRHLRRYSREALLDGVPYPKFWGEASHSGPLSTGQTQSPGGKARLTPQRDAPLREKLRGEKLPGDGPPSEAPLGGAGARGLSPRESSATALPPGRIPLGQLPPARHRLLLPEDEAEVERLFQRLKAEGSLEQHGPIGQHGAGQRGDQRGPEEK
jgi:hypothetical protein